MAISITDLLAERSKYSIQNSRDELIEARLSCELDRFALVTVESCFQKSAAKFRENGCYITGIFDLSSIFQPATGVHFSLYALSVRQPKIVKIGQYNVALACSSADASRGTFEPMNSLPDDYYSYCSKIEDWVNSGTTPEDSEKYEFNFVKHEDFDYLYPYSHRYTKRVITTLNLLSKEKTVPLCELAEIITAHRTDIKAKVISGKDLKYPFDPTRVAEGYASDIFVECGDIVVTPHGKVYLFNEKNFTNAFSVNPTMRIIRAKSVSPEYLYLYLNSDTAKTITNALSSGTVIKMISMKSLSSIPVIIPNKPVEVYQKAFKTISYGNSNIEGFYQQMDILKSHEDNLEGMLFDELRYHVFGSKDAAIKDFLLSDIKEIESCYKAKAFKAVLILTGSVLEGFLIDWLSELEGKDYFNNDYLVPDRRNPQMNKKADLIDYINAIKAIKKPKWMIEAEHAHEIRSKRNLVHAKLCLSQTEEINAATSKRVITYLNEIIATRFSIQSGGEK